MNKFLCTSFNFLSPVQQKVYFLRQLLKKCTCDLRFFAFICVYLRIFVTRFWGSVLPPPPCGGFRLPICLALCCAQAVYVVWGICHHHRCCCFCCFCLLLWCILWCMLSKISQQSNLQSILSPSPLRSCEGCMRHLLAHLLASPGQEGVGRKSWLYYILFGNKIYSLGIKVIFGPRLLSPQVILKSCAKRTPAVRTTACVICLGYLLCASKCFK